MPPTLLLVDLSFTGEERGKEEGLRVIADLLKMHPESKIYCGLLTSLYRTASVHDDWKRIASVHDLNRERFVLIPKDSLDKDKHAFLALIKLVVMNGPANALRKAVITVFEECLKQSDAELGKLDVFEFERIICLTSSEEGVWEPDTLLRVLSLFHKALVRKALRNDGEIYKYADYLRSLTSIRVGEWGGPTKMEISLRRLEWFEEPDDINEQHLPLEVGDVFKIDGRPDKLFVLVAQPCDLMMRQSGERHHTVQNALLLEATPVADASEESKKAKDEDRGFYFKLDFFEADRDWRINLRKIHYVNLDILDLCVFRTDGRATFSVGDTAPPLISEAWRARFPKLEEIVKKACGRYAELMKKNVVKAVDVMKIVVSSSLGNLIKSEIDSTTNTISFDISRVGRIKQPRSGALLTRYANALARDAFEHDLTRRPDRLLLKSGHTEDAKIENTEMTDPSSDANTAKPTSTENPPEVDQGATGNH
jgi:hypothetical protein